MANTKLKEVQDQLPATTSTFEEDSGEYQENLTADDQTHPTHPCLLYTSPSPRDRTRSRMPSSA